jgi:hypothetical protein
VKFLLVPGAIQHCEERFLEVPWKGQIARAVPNVGASSTPTEVTPTNVRMGIGKGTTVEGYGGEGYVCCAAC